jgi:uncharacterized protein (TIGR01777 family)
VSGASGLIGSALLPYLEKAGVQAVALRRGPGSGPRWDPDLGRLDPRTLEGFDAVVHLAGESIAGRFTRRRRRRVLDSRRRGTALLAESIALGGRRESAPGARWPRVLISASAVGIYGDRGDESLDEGSAEGSGFLAEVARVWEQATAPAREAGVRVVHLRNGLVMAGRGGALAPLLTLTRLGLGGPLGSGRQWWSWIALDDVLGLVRHALGDSRVRGVVNATTPEPARQADFARTLARVLGRPAIVPAPAFALRLVLGRGMADALLLASARVLPRAALETGYRFQFPDLEGALRHVLAA